MIYLKLRQAGVVVNHKHVDRLYAEAGLQVRRRKRKKIPMANRNVGGQDANQVWSMDFIFDRTAEGRSIKSLPVVDDATHEAVAIVVERAIGGQHLVRILDRLAAARGLPQAIRADTAWESGDNSSVGDIRFAMSNLPSAAWAYYPGQDNSPYGGDAWFNKSDYNDPVVGYYAYYTFLHEIGHTLGLEHPHENNDNDVMSLSVDALKYSIMSYRDYVGDDIDGVGENFFPTTPMLYDVLALQALYGANWNYRSGNDTYSWAPGAKVYETIWDGGGIDTLSAANQTRDVELHLTSGVFSKIGSPMWDEHAWVRDNLVIAFNATIENATGSNYDDYYFW